MENNYLNADSGSCIIAMYPIQPSTTSHSPWLITAHLLTVLFLVQSISFHTVLEASEADILVRFKDAIANNAALQDWDAGSNPCPPNGRNWVGVLCADGTVWGLQLENMSLAGSVDLDMLADLTALRTLSFMNNSLSGPIPRLMKLGTLKSVFLSRNDFSGRIPDDTFSGMGSLKKVYLSHNQFSGNIPSSLSWLTRLLELRLEENQFSGQIPEFHQRLASANFSFNALEGRIPASLSQLDQSSFMGNKDLCGDPLEMPCRSSNKLSIGLVLVFIMLGMAVVSAIVSVMSILIRRHRHMGNHALPRMVEIPSTTQKNKAAGYDDEDHLEHGSNSNVPGSSGVKKNKKEAELGKLTFVREYKDRFDLQDLLRAAAEVVGSGHLGSSYKAVLENGWSVVVKRFREMNGVGRQDFEEHMRRMGGLNHPNLLPLLAFYYRKEEKLMVTDFIANGSLMQLLQGSPSVDWVTRVRVIKGVARGVAYLHTSLPCLSLPHGQLKASNVLLSDSLEPLLTDYALDPVMNPTQLLVAYTSPEYAQLGRVSRKSDVWSLGIIILEVVTGKAVSDEQRKEEAMNLVSWVESIVREDSGTRGLLDGKMEWSQTGEGEMMKLLQIGLACCERNVEKRWELSEAVAKIEELRERGSGEGSTFTSEGDVYYSSRGGLSTEDISF